MDFLDLMHRFKYEYFNSEFGKDQMIKVKKDKRQKKNNLLVNLLDYLFFKLQSMFLAMKIKDDFQKIFTENVN